MEYLNVLEPDYKNKQKRWYSDRTFICSSMACLFITISFIFNIYIVMSVMKYVNQTNIEGQIENAFTLVNQVEDTTGEYQLFLIQAKEARNKIMEIADRVNETNNMISIFIDSVCREYPSICSF